MTLADARPSNTVALVNSSGPFSGITLSARPYAVALARMGVGVRWYQCIDAGAETFVPDGGEAVRGVGLPIESLDMGLNRLWAFPKGLRRAPERILLLTDPTLSYVARNHRSTVVLVHDLLQLSEFSDRLDSRWMFRFVVPRLNRMSRVIVTTGTMRAELIRRNVDPSIIRVIPYTHDLGYHPEHPARVQERVVRTGRVRLLYVATDRPHKNIDFALRLAKALEPLREGPRFTMTILSQLAPGTERRIEDLHLTNLHVVSRVPSVTELYEEHDILVYPSLHEGFGRPLIEAMAYGYPIVANRIQPLIEILDSAGTLLPVSSVGPWVEALQALATGSRYAEAAARSLARATRFLPDQFQLAVEQVFGELFGRS